MCLALQERLQQQLQRRENVLQCFQAAGAATAAETSAAEAVPAAHDQAGQVSKWTSLHTRWLLTLPFGGRLTCEHMSGLRSWLCQGSKEQAVEALRC